MESPLMIWNSDLLRFSVSFGFTAFVCWLVQRWTGWAVILEMGWAG
jgi:hypothetical protein